jgi:hypothetical protein
MPLDRPAEPGPQPVDGDGPGARAFDELLRRGVIPPARTPKRRNLDGLSLSELTDVLAERHGGPTYEEDDD